jgi:hypothetical protein
MFVDASRLPLLHPVDVSIYKNDRWILSAGCSTSTTPFCSLLVMLLRRPLIFVVFRTIYEKYLQYVQ